MVLGIPHFKKPPFEYWGTPSVDLDTYLKQVQRDTFHFSPQASFLSTHWIFTPMMVSVLVRTLEVV